MQTHPSRPNTMAFLALLVLLGCLVAACGGSGSSQPAATATTLSGPPVKLRVLAPEGTPSANYPDAQAGARAAAKAINAAGGIKGSPIEVSFCNTKFEANAAADCARQAVADGMVAIVGHPSTAPEAQVLPMFETAHLPDIGLQPTGNVIEYTSPASWPIQSGTFGAIMALPFAAQQMGSKKFAFAIADVPSLKNLAGHVRQAAKAANLNLQFTDDILVPLSGVTDFAPFAQQAKERGADSVLILLGPPATAAMIGAVRSLDPKMRLFRDNFSFGEAELNAAGAAADGTILSAPWPPFRATNPGIAKFNKEMDAAGYTDTGLHRATAVNAWLSVYAVVEIAKSVQGTLTRESLWAALPKTGELDLNGLVKWNPSQIGKASFLPRLPTTEFQFQRFQSGKITAATDLKPVSPMAAIRAQG